MRLWSLHPRYLDRQGLVALWREGLLAKKVLENKTKGYRNHPQLDRFKESGKALGFINAYLHFVCDEAEARDYQFDRSKLKTRRPLAGQLTVGQGQVEHEWSHLLKKLAIRSPDEFSSLRAVASPDVHPLFMKVSGPVEPWERLP